MGKETSLNLTTLKRPLRLTWSVLYQQFGVDCLRELKEIKAAWPDLHYRTVKGALVLSPSQLRLVE